MAAVAALCAVQFVDVLGVTVVITALPSILNGLGASSSSAGLVVAAYAMFFGGLLMLGARLGDRYGHQRVLLVGLAGFAGASALAAVAPSVEVLVAARCLQGAAAALSVPAALRLLNESARDEEARRRGLAAWSAAGAAAGASGFVLGGVLTDVAGWRAVFWINVPLAVALVLAVRAKAPAPPGHRGARLDIAGGALLTASVMSLVLGASWLERRDERVAGVIVVVLGVVLAGAFVVAERRSEHPLVPALALRRPRLRLGGSAAFLNTATTSSAVTLATLFLQDDHGTSPSAAGLWLLPFSLAVIAGSALVARAALPPARTIGAGLAIIAGGNALLLAAPAAIWLLPVAVALGGLGIGLSSVAANAVGMDVEPSLQGTAAGALNTAAQLGTALGVAAVLLVAQVTSIRFGWGVAAAGALAAALVALRSRHRL
jgi:MFS family permease